MVDKKPAKKLEGEATEKPKQLEINLVDLPQLIVVANGVKYKLAPQPFASGVYYLTEAN